MCASNALIAIGTPIFVAVSKIHFAEGPPYNNTDENCGTHRIISRLSTNWK